MAENRTPQMPPPPELPSGGEPKYDAVKSLRARKGPIEVIALSNGLYKNQRIPKGKQFKIDKPEHLGSWMKCVDKTIQAEHAHYCREHKKKMQNIDRQSAGD